jgi:hypothetical protein
MSDIVFARKKTNDIFLGKRLFQMQIVNESVQGFWPAFKFLQRNSTIQLALKDGTDLQCRNREQAYAYGLYFYLGKRLGVYSRSELFEIIELSEFIKHSMENVFSDYQLKYNAGAPTYFTATLLALYVLIRYVKPDLIIQTGVASGVSSSLILFALDKNAKGKLIDIDLPNRNEHGYRYYDGTIDTVFTPEGMQPGWLVPNKLRKRWDLRLGPSKEILPTIEKCDIFYHDSEHSYQNMMFEFEWAYAHLSDLGILASDDIHFSRAWSYFHSKRKSMYPLLGHLSFGISQRNAV